MNHLNHKSRVTVSYVYMSYQFISLFQSSEIFPWKSCVTVLIINSTFTLYGYPRSSAAQRSSALWRVTASGLRRRSCSWPLQRLCQHICHVFMYVSMCTLINRQYHLTIQVKIGCPTDWVESRNLGSNAAWVLSPPCTVGRDADSVASSHSAPIRVLYCLYSESGLFWSI